jgi:putative Ca2+/H+ antiporter (TMEM165/GDT1 family)
VDGDCLEANQVNPGIAAVCFGVVFVAELPDMTALASLVLGARYRPGYVFPGVAAALGVQPPPSPWRVGLTSFAIIFVAEFGDITQIMTANLAVKYHAPVSGLAGSMLGLWSVAALAILGRQGLLGLVPLALVTRLAATVLAALGIATLVSAIAA